MNICRLIFFLHLAVFISAQGTWRNEYKGFLGKYARALLKHISHAIPSFDPFNYDIQQLPLNTGLEKATILGLSTFKVQRLSVIDYHNEPARGEIRLRSELIHVTGKYDANGSIAEYLPAEYKNQSFTVNSQYTYILIGLQPEIGRNGYHFAVKYVAIDWDGLEIELENLSGVDEDLSRELLPVIAADIVETFSPQLEQALKKTAAAFLEENGHKPSVQKILDKILKERI